MAILTDAEPTPRARGDHPVSKMTLGNLLLLPKAIETSATSLCDVLAHRRSSVGGSIPLKLLGAVLWHSMQLRERQFNGRFGQWESRPSPSAGGVHAIQLLILPLDPGGSARVYDNDLHALGTYTGDGPGAIALNRLSIDTITTATSGTTVQLFADPTRLAACYENHETLLWRDAGALLATICFAATAFGLTSVALGRQGTNIVRTFGLPEPVQGVGGVHLGWTPGDAV